MTPKVLWEVVRKAAQIADIEKLAPHDLRRTCARLSHLAGGELDQIQFLLGQPPFRQQSVIWAANKSCITPSMTSLESKCDLVSALLWRIARPLPTREVLCSKTSPHHDEM
jgi:hypothetical protein